jgi:hypothetical protein
VPRARPDAWEWREKGQRVEEEDVPRVVIAWERDGPGVSEGGRLRKSYEKYVKS